MCVGKRGWLIPLIISIPLSWPIGAQVKTASDDAIRLPAATGSAHPFRDVLKPGLGFSFAYDGKRVGPGRPEGWQISSRAGGQELVLRHPSGLVVTRKTRVWPESEAIEYTLTFKNESRQTLPSISAVSAMDLSFGAGVLPGLSMVTSGGGDADSFYPPRDFALRRVEFGPMTPLDGQVILTTVDGYPSRTTLPFYFLDNPSKSAGLFVGIGSSGQWRAMVNASFSNGSLRLQGVMPEVNLKLGPGEEFSGPNILLGCSRGSLADGANMLRRLIRDHYLPPQRDIAPLLYSTWFDIGTELDEKLANTLVDRAAEIGMEIFLVDAGWYKGAETVPYTNMAATWGSLSRPLGNWELGPELSRFPSGLRPLADKVRSKGMQFGLWFEPERSGQASLLAEKHPEWTITLGRRPWRVVDFGRPEVQEYFCKIIDRYIRELGVRYIRWDQNLEMQLYWQSRDPEDRKGITEIRHLEGVHRVEDWIRKNHPDVMLEACASGGNRIDLATIQRRHTFWISDQTMDPLIVRFHLEGMNHFMPGDRQLVGFSPPKSTYQQPGFTFPDLAFQSYFGGSFGASGRLHEWPEALKAQTRKHVAIYKQLRRFLREDYYLLEPQAQNLESWSGWQFHDPKSDEGFVQAFRIRSQQGSHALFMKGLNPKLKYRFTDPYTGKSFDLSGAALTSKGVAFTLAPMSSSVLIYHAMR
jgi:alpha-galactosidase